MIQNVTKKTLQVELLNMKISSDKQHMYTLNMHISIPNIVLLKLPCLQLLLSSADHHFKHHKLEPRGQDNLAIYYSSASATVLSKGTEPR